MLIESVESLVSWSPVGRHTGMPGSREKGQEWEEGDDRRGHAVSESEGASARTRAGRDAGPRARE
jgi:hypothetical protein